MRSIADEMIRQGSHNKIRNSYKIDARLLAKEQMKLVTEDSSPQKMSAFQRRLGDFFKTVPAQFLPVIIEYYNSAFQKELKNLN